jgi:hypothetical protein
MLCRVTLQLTRTRVLKICSYLRCCEDFELVKELLQLLPMKGKAGDDGFFW